MPAPMTRAGSRGSQFVRMWKLLVILRGTPRTLAWLATELGASQRTVRRDLAVLQSAGMPIGSVGGHHDSDGFSNMPPSWFVGRVREWPRRHATPTEVLSGVISQSGSEN